MSSSNDELIEAYRTSASRPIRARMMISLLLIVAIFTNLSMMYSGVRDFVDEGLPELTATLQTQMAPVVAKSTERLGESIGKVSNAYKDAFTEVYIRDASHVEQSIRDEGARLEKYVHSQWPKFEQAIAELAIAQEDVIQAEVTRVVGENGVTEISMQYQDALVKEFEKALGTVLQSHVDISDEIGQKFQKLASKEPDIQAPVDPHQTLGLLLELLGIELQATVE